MREITGVTWIYYCLLCLSLGQSPCRSLYFLNIKQHIRHEHRVSVIKPFVHYVDTTKTYREAIDSIRKICFPNSISNK